MNNEIETNEFNLLKTNDKVVAATVVSIIRKCANSEGIVYIGSVSLSEDIFKTAEAAGTARHLLNKIGRQGYTKREDGLKLDVQGTLAELIVHQILAPDTSALFSPLVNYTPDFGNDLQLPGLQVDIKSVIGTREFLNINKSNHIKKQAAVYLMVRIVDNQFAHVFCVSAKDASTWEEKTTLYGKPIPAEQHYIRTRLPLISIPNDYY